ncbi:hypothetical protein NVP1069O_14 [Vibrio phage 1.069.O._10N.286.49.F11]|uniref:Uncharacterized protein n=7 Tax=Autolykiviridae TaxID=2184034 RepID=A0A2I7S831_9VIRU|nr:hypothetical protein KMD65_gp17 [Vibrio phage 1.008.O._10N.286.54.E5]AUR81642.1 hypothetical protein NVP1011O_13 [Vibrio phage 1.011.O._10N.286.49.B11]AUR83781.1 hypothetical protein NVP1040O_14 [Vibrio phage 1.040.O._10N.286.45.B9]AUR84660.1 hypothetical protein NVP1062O_14 [Vibrio phage 1.062.O._10N.286.55.C3]AUR85157.1 hypothetical protein NVP1069O_14 [Vibrio phage 1.069.O._10N.286.49.F11]AUR89585.1 hypothetical protein NVP1125O_14 [Vibrio phage 1.125.O._10N.286.49.F5]AUS02074.1 hypothe
MPFLLPIAVLAGTGVFAWKAGDAVNNVSDKLVSAAIIGGAAYLIYKGSK